LSEDQHIAAAQGAPAQKAAFFRLLSFLQGGKDAKKREKRRKSCARNELFQRFEPETRENFRRGERRASDERLGLSGDCIFVALSCTG